MIEQTCCFTGHRVIPKERYAEISDKLYNTVEELIKNGYLTFCAGGALGFDTIAELTVLKLKKIYDAVRLNLILPCESQPAAWKNRDRANYENIIKQADNVLFASAEYTPQCMYARNRLLVNSSSLCVCYLTKCTGGTYYTVRYAEKQGMPIINTAGQK